MDKGRKEAIKGLMETMEYLNKELDNIDYAESVMKYNRIEEAEIDNAGHVSTYFGDPNGHEQWVEFTVDDGDTVSEMINGRMIYKVKPEAWDLIRYGVYRRIANVTHALNSVI